MITYLVQRKTFQFLPHISGGAAPSQAPVCGKLCVDDAGSARLQGSMVLGIVIDVVSVARACECAP